jgi:hypothetical protein
MTIGGLARVLLYLWAVEWILWTGVAHYYRWWDASSFLSLLWVLVLLPCCFFLMLWLITRRFGSGWDGSQWSSRSVS